MKTVDDEIPKDIKAKTWMNKSPNRHRVPCTIVRGPSQAAFQSWQTANVEVIKVSGGRLP